MIPIFFPTPSDLHKWFEENHDKATELLVGYYKVGSGKQSITWQQSVEEALCFGWIDSIRKSIDSESYCNRFTPRKPNSNWSAINIKKIGELIEQARMHPAGLAAFEKRQEKNSRIYSYENEPAQLTKEYLQKFKSNKQAWSFFQSQPPSYQKTAIHLVMRAKQQKTQLGRLETLIRDSAAGRKIAPLSYNAKKS